MRLVDPAPQKRNFLGAGDFQALPALDRFDEIEVEVLPGQEWYFAGDLVFKRGDDVTLRLRGVSRPESFRQVCMKAHLSHVGVRAALQSAGA